MFGVQERAELTARSGFLVSRAPAGQLIDRQVLLDFYQPIVGPEAVGLLLTLASMQTPHPQLSQRQPHSKLLVHLNIGLPALRSSLRLLEAVGLLKTYYQHDDLGDCYVYELQPSLTPEDFINDPLLSVLLLDAVGETYFKHLVQRYRRFQVDTSGLTNVSAKIFDVFHLQADDDELEQATLADARRSTKVPTSSRPQLGTPVTDFNFATLMTLLGSAGPSEEAVKQQRQLIKMEHVLYGIDEPTMAQLILQATDLHNQFDSKLFKRLVAKAYPRVARPTAEHHKDQPADSARPATQESTASQNLTAQEKQLIETCQKYSPNDFLVQLKDEAGGGYVTPGETKILQRLIDEGKLPAPVINLLSWYVIVEQGHATLSAGFVDAIANAWIRAGVKTVPAGLNEIHRYFQQRQGRQNSFRSYRRRPVRKEAKPQWQRDEQAGKKVKKTSAKQAAEVKKLLASLHQDEDQ